jgi:hypothetical protein
MLRRVDQTMDEPKKQEGRENIRKMALYSLQHHHGAGCAAITAAGLVVDGLSARVPL